LLASIVQPSSRTLVIKRSKMYYVGRFHGYQAHKVRLLFYFHITVDFYSVAPIIAMVPPGFSRAIAQLLVHKLIPLIVDVSSAVVYEDKTKDDAVLTSIYEFLENNGEMARLRSKQANFFDSYDVDGACSLEGLLSIPVDEGEEACPTHLVDAIKDCLVEVYAELHEEDAPLWKQMEDLSVNDKGTPPQKVQDETEVHDEAELVNFQRKILPLDALDLSIQSMKDQKLFNAAGKKKQDLIICATLVDKVPNLAGLARTAEIFAASTLVIPNLLVRKQDDFKTISASANDWIEMEECKEDELLSWLYKKKSQGYTIVGLEQTSSSKCITKFKYPNKTVLLLGKEKEG
jgi:tRNA guanosine-2'-O-methyltransferase